jgi:hypothetical protein
MKELGTEGDEGELLYRISRIWTWIDLLHWYTTSYLQLTGDAERTNGKTYDGHAIASLLQYLGFLAVMGEPCTVSPGLGR